MRIFESREHKSSLEDAFLIINHTRQFHLRGGYLAAETAASLQSIIRIIRATPNSTSMVESRRKAWVLWRRTRASVRKVRIFFAKIRRFAYLLSKDIQTITLSALKRVAVDVRVHPPASWLWAASRTRADSLLPRGPAVHTGGLETALQTPYPRALRQSKFCALLSRSGLSDGLEKDENYLVNSMSDGKGISYGLR
jgi:hypothetical protein